MHGRQKLQFLPGLRAADLVLEGQLESGQSLSFGEPSLESSSGRRELCVFFLATKPENQGEVCVCVGGGREWELVPLFGSSDPSLFYLSPP